MNAISDSNHSDRFRKYESSAVSTLPAASGFAISSEPGTGAAISKTDDQVLEALATVFLSKDEGRVRNFLTDKPLLSSILFLVRRSVSEFFDTHLLFLEVVSDPDQPGSEYLALCIPTLLDSATAFDYWNKLHTAIVGYLDQCGGLLSVDVHFQ
jgi:hypothetical protein